MRRLSLFLFLLLILFGGRLRFSQPPRAVSAPLEDLYELVQSLTAPGGEGEAGIYTLDASSGEPAVGEIAAGDYTLGGGLWGGGELKSATASTEVYLPSVLK